MQRYIVLADIHGQKRLYDNALSHSKYNKDTDILIIAGDWCDIGLESRELWDIIQEEADVILIGNHELAHILKKRISPYDYSLDIGPMCDEMAGCVLDGKIQLAAAVGPVVISHGGISDELVTERYEGYKIYELVDSLNDELRNGIVDNDGSYGITSTAKWLWWDANSPLWFRPAIENVGKTPFIQVSGHTPVWAYSQELGEQLERGNFYVIDPYVGDKFYDDGFCVYGEIVLDDDDNILSVSRVVA